MENRCAGGIINEFDMEKLIFEAANSVAYVWNIKFIGTN